MSLARGSGGGEDAGCGRLPQEPAPRRWAG